NVLKRNSVLLVPVRTGVGARLGVSVGYLKLTQKPTWNPF
ncbi:MAG: EipA family protein, partial [Pseudomonadota bacterium]